MRLRPFFADRDFEIIAGWAADERTHAMWCANLFNFPLEKSNFESVLKNFAEKFGDSPFVATTDDGKVIGFFCYSSNLQTNEGMLKFVMIDSQCRGSGYGKEMILLASKYAFEIAKVSALQLNVFSENLGAKKCYQSCGFAERHTDSKVFKFSEEMWSRCNMVLKKAEN